MNLCRFQRLLDNIPIWSLQSSPGPLWWEGRLSKWYGKSLRLCSRFGMYSMSFPSKYWPKRTQQLPSDLWLSQRWWTWKWSILAELPVWKETKLHSRRYKQSYSLFLSTLPLPQLLHLPPPFLVLPFLLASRPTPRSSRASCSGEGPSPFHTHNRINIRIGRSCGCTLNPFLLQTCTFCTAYSAGYSRKTEALGCRTLPHEPLTGILHRILVCTRCKAFDFQMIFWRSPHNFISDTFCNWGPWEWCRTDEFSCICPESRGEEVSGKGSWVRGRLNILHEGTSLPQRCLSCIWHSDGGRIRRKNICAHIRTWKHSFSFPFLLLTILRKSHIFLFWLHLTAYYWRSSSFCLPSHYFFHLFLPSYYYWFLNFSSEECFEQWWEPFL